MVAADMADVRSSWRRCDGLELEALLLPDVAMGNESPVALLDARFLVEVAKHAGGRLRRRQDIPPAAFIPAHVLTEMPSRSGGLPVICVSYPWLQPDHPDPKGTTLRLLARVLETYIAQPRPDARGRQYPASTFAVFLDFCCLHQKDEDGERTANERTLFSRALGSLDSLYSHPHTHLFKVSTLPAGYPAGFVFPDGVHANTAAYYDRGWCFCESAMGNLVKNAGKVLDLANFSGKTDRQGGVINECKAGRQPPLTPADFAARLASKSFTSKAADLGTVTELYRRAFDKRISEAKTLGFSSLGWGDEEVVQLCRALEQADACRTLGLHSNAIGDRGAAAIAACLHGGGLSGLRWLNLNANPCTTSWMAMSELEGARDDLDIDARPPRPAPG